MLNALGELDNLLGDGQDVLGPAGLCGLAEPWGENRPDHSMVSALLRALSRWSWGYNGNKALSVLASFLFVVGETGRSFILKSNAAVPPVCNHR